MNLKDEKLIPLRLQIRKLADPRQPCKEKTPKRGASWQRDLSQFQKI